MIWNRLYRPFVLVGIWVIALGGPIALDAQNGSLTRLIGYVDPPHVAVDSGPDLAGHTPRFSQPTAAAGSPPALGPADAEVADAAGRPLADASGLPAAGALTPDQQPRSSSLALAPPATRGQPPADVTALTPTPTPSQPASAAAAQQPIDGPVAQPAIRAVAPSQTSALAAAARAAAATPWTRDPLVEPRPAPTGTTSRTTVTRPAPILSIDTPGSGSAILSKSVVVPGDHWSYDLVVRNSGNQPFNYLLSIKAVNSSGLDAPETLDGAPAGLRLRVFRCAATFATCGVTIYDGPVAISALSVGFLAVRSDDSLRLELRLPADSSSALMGQTSVLDLTWTAAGA